MLENKNWFYHLLVSPNDGTSYSHYADGLIYFGTIAPTAFTIVNNEVPVLVSDGLFDATNIKSKTITTQNPEYGDTRLLKNYIRRNLLPSLNNDKSVVERFNWLKKHTNNTEPTVLVIGAGQKSAFYKSIFGNKTITSDVHLQYGVDLVLDAHSIPFKDNTFDIVLAQQVLEHCMRPWEVAKELQRVLKPGGKLQIEVPFGYPYHSAPYDFYRFTYSGVRCLFSKCKTARMVVTEGVYTSVAIAVSTAFIESSNNRWIRMVMLFLSRLLLWPFKYLDVLTADKIKNHLSLPKGYCITLELDEKNRTDMQLIEEIKIELEQKLK